ncbi:anucleate primary sterigmata protein B [Aspergillus terreus NIH2624]|uniref:Anucleate primary sterigmata protein B n=1 Tax=Aspergillus terreus (strain NIH 2624 / FGSC A1156) TaxID=341663 RepID=Q0CBH0_ASPTN|nr:anucleate primary sterigmata protein B [Aspergillus terreus NIH2624]EAU31096.1 anucleate primary sterigmata protein B [Aspergillus terreus NIH2624]
MSTSSAQPSSFKPLHATEYAPPPRRPSPFSLPSDLDSEDDYLQLEDDHGAPIDLMVEEDSRGDHPPNNMDTTGPHDGADHAQEDTTIGTRPDDHSIFTAGNTDLDDSNASLNLPPLPDNDDSSLYLLSSEDGDRERIDNQTFMEEKEMRQKLMDMESSFLPEPSTVEVAAANQTHGMDDTYLVGVSGENAADPSTNPELTQPSVVVHDESSHDLASTTDGVPVPQTPSLGPAEDTTVDLDTTPAGASERYDDHTTMLEAPSSPAADAAARTENRNLFSSSHDAHETGQESHDMSNDRSLVSESGDSLRPGQESVQTTLRSLSPGLPRLFHDTSNHDIEGASRTSSRRSGRPKYLMSRQSANRLSYSSVATSNTEATNSEATLGADYALQSGGAAPGSSIAQPARRDPMARSVSLGSMASGVSGYSDENVTDKKNRSTSAVDGGLQTLDEEEGTSPSRPGSSQQRPQDQSTIADAGPVTPKAKTQDHVFPTDTVLAERVKDVQVPSTFVRQFREDFGGRGVSPDKRAGATPAFGRSGRSMTLKEQSSTIDRLSKENFDLKMRIHFLNEALNRRSEEGIKEMISENVELKSDKLKLQKDNQTLKRKIRDLEKQLKDQQSDKESMLNHDPEGSDESDRDPAQDEEILYLRERVESYELEIERMRSESIARESEKRRLAEVVKSLSEGRPMGSDVGAREERDMWKDILEAETAAREQAEEENKRLRDEALRLRSEMSMAVVPARPGPRDRFGSMASYSGASERDFNRHTTTGSSSSSTLVMELELLKQENAELRKEVSAQTSMLTSRNREKERLYQEIEELKLGQRRDARSVTGDSIFDRSASRAQGRPSSRTSDGTGRSPADDADRDELEMRNGQLRDQLSALKLENQDIRAQLEEYMRELEALDKAYQADVDQAEEEIQNLQQERDQALHMADERDAAFQDLRAEAQEELDALGEEFDQKVEECQRLGEELRNQDENFRALQAEMRSASEGIIRLEEDAQNNLHRYQAVQRELEDCNREMESLEKSLYEANTKVQRLTVQIESSQNEIAFLREEQDGDKIKIGNLELELKTYKMDLQSERDKTRELEERLAEERHQREVVGSKEKQEVQRIVNELNREASAAKEEVRKLKKSLSAQEIETATWRERLLELEKNLRETLGDLTGSRSSLISNIMKLQKTLETTALELESVRSKLEEKESLLRNRDALLESHGLESRKLAELLERERHARRADKQSFEKALKSHQQASRTITQNNSKISDLELARSQDRKRFNNLEQQYKDQLTERNAMLLTMWKRLSAMCGPDWAHSNSLINGNLPSQEVIGNILFWPGFSRNLLLAVKTVEHVFSGFKARIKDVERDLTKQYQSLEHNFNQRSKKLDNLIESMVNLRAQQYTRSQSGLSPEMAKLRVSFARPGVCRDGYRLSPFIDTESECGSWRWRVLVGAAQFDGREACSSYPAGSCAQLDQRHSTALPCIVDHARRGRRSHGPRVSLTTWGGCGQ